MRRYHLNFLYEITKANIKLQNEHSYLGIFWYLLGPLLMFATLLYVFGGRLGSSIEYYPLYLLLGIINWNFFAAGTGRSMIAIVSNAGLIKALPIPLPLLVVSTVGHALLSHIVELIVFFGMMTYMGIEESLALYFALSLCMTALFTLGMGFMLASAFVFVRDLGEIWNILTRVWWFATPIFYGLSPTGPGWNISLYNPMFYSIHIARETLIYGRIPSMHMFLAFATIAIGTCCIGYGCFVMTSRRFVDYL